MLICTIIITFCATSSLSPTVRVKCFEGAFILSAAVAVAAAVALIYVRIDYSFHSNIIINTYYYFTRCYCGVQLKGSCNSTNNRLFVISLSYFWNGV